MADRLNTYDNVDWATFRRRFKWRQGEHALAVAPTGGGKSTLLEDVLRSHKYVVVFVTKGRDPTFENRYLKNGYRRIHSWPPPSYANRVLLWPKAGSTIRETVANQKRVFRHALDSIFQTPGWTVCVDEEHYICSTLGLSDEVAMYLHQGRSSGLTLANGTQRPAWIPVVTYSSSDHAFLWRTNDPTDLKRLSMLGGINAKELAHNMLTLGKHDVIYVPARSGKDPIRTRMTL